MKRLILAILFVTAMLNLSGCVVVDRHHKSARRVVVVSPPPGHRPERPGFPNRPNADHDRRGRPGNRFGRH